MSSKCIVNVSRRRETQEVSAGYVTLQMADLWTSQDKLPLTFDERLRRLDEMSHQPGQHHLGSDLIVADVDGSRNRLTEHGGAKAQAITFPILLGDFELRRVARAQGLDPSLDPACRFRLSLAMGKGDNDGIHGASNSRYAVVYSNSHAQCGSFI